MTAEVPVFVEHVACPKCRQEGRDASGDNLAVYSDGSAHCFHPKCDMHVKSVDELEEVDVDLEELKRLAKEKPKKEPISLEQRELVEANTTLKGLNFRGINDEILKYYGVRSSYDPEGSMYKRFYPITTDGKLTAFKVRMVKTKDFFWIGSGGNTSDFAGQGRFKNLTGKNVLIVGGEEDMLAAQQMLWEYAKRANKEHFGKTPVIAPVSGEDCVEFLKSKYAYLNKASKIILGFDSDEAGKQAMEKALKVLPKGKTYVADWPLKDPNECLIKGKEREFISAFFKVEKSVPEGITSSDNLEDKMLEYVSLERVGLPDCFAGLQRMLCGGFPLGYIVNILAASGIGKTTFVDEMILHWIMNASYTTGVVSLEASDGEYGVNLSSAYCGFKLNLLESAEERIEYLRRPENVEKRKKLWTKEDGSPRFYLVDSDIDNLQSKVEELIISFGCKIIVLDPLQDIFDCMEDSEQKKFMKWQKDLVKREKVLFVNINHSRKASTAQKSGSKGADLTEEDMHGVSAIFKSGAINIILSRNKEAADEITRNTTKVKVTKARGVGNTGIAGYIYYDNHTHTLHDKETYMAENQGEM